MFKVLLCSDKKINKSTILLFQTYNLFFESLIRLFEIF